MKHHAKELPRIKVGDAVKKYLDQCRADGKSMARMHQLECYLNPFADSMNCEVGEVMPGIVSRYLTGLDLSERSKKNARDVLGFSGRWCVLHGYLERGSDLYVGRFINALTYRLPRRSGRPEPAGALPDTSLIAPLPLRYLSVVPLQSLQRYDGEVTEG